MSTLQIWLAIIGGLILAAVVAHGAWAARKNLPKQATPEPVTPAPTTDEGQVGDAEPERQEPDFDLDSGLATLTALTVLDKKPGLDVLIDVIAPITIDSVVSGEAALAAMPGTRRAGSKPFAVEGLSIETGTWEMPTPGQRYSAFQAGVQLANRTGALNQIEFSEFVMKAQAFADAIDGQPEFPDMQDEVARARELDQFASVHDAQLSFTLRANDTAWSPGYVQQHAGKQGFVAGSIPGRMVLPASESGHAPILGLAFDTQAAMAEDPEQTALREVTLTLDVPQVLRSEQPFVRMCEAAIGLATSMGGVIIDDQGQPIRPEAMEVIHADLEKLYDTLEERDLSAGSVLGRRLFS
ncbi:MAG TPA: cell division protein ZipA C-terminal FtsZ-binding domain-containing protein [Polaromonas sp.]|uniref:cell division protein ZipA C-terminal FtsZ-binding domain-containing protein n=1 Tax=Polaromonas sp. TaxID=1869339 RepID=UPI002D376F4B|nr:cell division protein ZipA C-terminal FtsZ-binding domain-containing protein [Polaromonas sp.]HYW58719.1 cell division protein ZipA C-terminal FtsZ-binding domain-containing protein [Polaromonas sp.]